MSTHNSPLPNLYYFVFGAYEPFITIVGLLGTLANPLEAYIAQAPWPEGMKPPHSLPLAALVTLVQLAHVCALVGVINLFVLYAIRKHLRASPAMQEHILWALFTPLAIGDFGHLGVTFWALGDQRFEINTWNAMMWANVVVGLSLLIPRVCWHIGIGRYVDNRDGRHRRQSSKTKLIAKT